MVHRSNRSIQRSLSRGNSNLHCLRWIRLMMTIVNARGHTWSISCRTAGQNLLVVFLLTHNFSNLCTGTSRSHLGLAFPLPVSFSIDRQPSQRGNKSLSMGTLIATFSSCKSPDQSTQRRPLCRLRTDSQFLDNTRKRGWGSTEQHIGESMLGRENSGATLGKT
jgi:hypothetical protein